MINKPLSVSQVVQTLKQTINQNELLKNVTVVGELSNFNPHRSGHFYFTLKDENSRMECVMFAGKSKIKFQPKDGDKVIIGGYLDVYLASGKVQIYAQSMNLDGLGDLHIRFEELKKLLFKEGYFNEDLKKPIEKYPEHIAVISAKDSAAHADVSKTLKERWPLAEQINYFAYVQGENAVPSLIAQLKKANQEGLADTIILSRGGGSIEDLWAFNDPELIKAMVASHIPIICGVGHESDNTLAELAADLRAATPTAAAVAATPHKLEVNKQLRDYKNKFYLAVKRKNEQNIHHYKSVVDNSYLNYPERFFGFRQQRIDEINMNFNAVMNRFQNVRRIIANQEAELGYNFKRIMEKKGRLIAQQEVFMHHKMDQLLLANKHKLESNTIKKDLVSTFIKANQAILESHQENMIRAVKQQLKDEKQSFVYLVDQLHHLSPLEIMKRGFSIASLDGKVVKSIEAVEVADTLNIRVQDGIIETRVLKKEGFR